MHGAGARAAAARAAAAHPPFRALLLAFVGTAVARMLWAAGRQEAFPLRAPAARAARGWTRPEPPPLSGRVNTALGGADRVRFFMYPGMARLTGRVLDCLSFGAGLGGGAEDADGEAAAATAWFRGARFGPAAAPTRVPLR